MRPNSALAVVVTLFVSATGLMAQNGPAGQAAPGGRGGRGGAPETCGPNPPATLRNVATDSRCFELRTYTVRAEGPGSIDLLHARFRDQTLMYFQKHEMNVVGFWQPLARPDTLIYLLAFENAAARNAAWAAFNADPGWQAARQEMNVGIDVQSEFLIATDYGPMK